VVNLLSLLFITPVVAFYMLRDWDRMVVRIDGWLPLENRDVIRSQFAEIDRTLAGFARGQALLCLSLGGFYALSLSAAGLDFGFVIGVATGILSFIPYVGTLTGAALSIGFAILQFDSWTPVLVIGGIYLFGQIIEGNVLQPLLVGDRVGLHPVWVIFSLLAGGALMGFVGILVAIPVAATLGVLIRFFVGRYLKSQFYLGRS
jgi:predicted PurR-regulated permease PerM